MTERKMFNQSSSQGKEINGEASILSKIGEGAQWCFYST